MLRVGGSSKDSPQDNATDPQGRKVKMKLSISKAQLSRIARAGLAFAVLAGMVWAHEQSVPEKQGAVRYIITDLGTLGGPFSEALDVNNNGLVRGVAPLTDGTERLPLAKGSDNGYRHTWTGRSEQGSGDCQ